MQGDKAPSDWDDAVPQSKRDISRSPHPYHRHQNEDSHGVEHHEYFPQLRVEDFSQTTQSANGDTEGYLNKEEREERRKRPESPSESGTEADDEKGAFLISLPAPPSRPRKGLKEGYGSSSPLLTPSYIDEATKKLSLDEAFEQEKDRTTYLSAKLYGLNDREKFIRRRRAELARRITESILLCSIYYIVAARGFSWLLHLNSYTFSTDASDDIQKPAIYDAPIGYFWGLFSLYGLYPVRIILKNHRLSITRNKPWFYIHIPAAFDPATLLYPTLLPVLAASSMTNGLPGAIPLNVTLGLASVPYKIIPMSSGIPWYWSFHWAISALQVSASRTFDPLYVKASSLQSPLEWPLTQENVVCSSFLHQALMPVLEYLTTSSLLPAERQLLSVSLINLLILAHSAQAIILQALLWLGGLLTLIFCWRACHWEVVLARVPSWRFRRSKYFTRESKVPVYLQAIDDLLRGSLSARGWLPYGNELSDDEASPLPSKLSSARKKRHFSIDIKAKGSLGFMDESQVTPTAPLLSSPHGHGAANVANGPLEASRVVKRHGRRSTMPSNLGDSSQNSVLQSLATVNSAKDKSKHSFSFRSLTMPQAIVLNRAFATYIYLFIILVIAVPVRLYISHHALRGHEPVGWALNYLFGDIVWFRGLDQSPYLRHWLSLPILEESRNLTPASRTIAGMLDAIGSRNTRLLICFYCLGIIVLGLATVFQLTMFVEVDTRRKVFHGMMVAMFLPTIFIDPLFISLALTLILAIFLLLDLFRASQLPPLSRPLTHFLAPYVDGRDHRGPVIVSHIFLLIGCAIPLWLSIAAVRRSDDSSFDDWYIVNRDLSMISGVVCVGMGDAAASLIGRRFGRRRWPWTGGKSLEGSLAFAIAVLLGLTLARFWLLMGGWEGDSGDNWMTFVQKGLISACGASLTEAVLTGGNDNVIVPVVLWLLVKGLRV